MLDLLHLRAATTAGHPHPWPVLHELNETYKVGALPADDGSGLVLYPAAGLLQSEKEAALRFAQKNLEALLHDLALEHLPRQVWLDARRIASDARHTSEGRAGAKPDENQGRRPQRQRQTAHHRAGGQRCA